VTRNPAASDEGRIAPQQSIHLLYHEVRTGASSYTYAIDQAMFERHLDLYARLIASGTTPQPAITFDDGHVSNIQLAAPSLASRGLAATFFITVGWTGTKNGYMDWSELKALHAAGHNIGAHGWSHKLLTHCSDAELDQELRKARLTLEDGLGAAVSSISLPGGRFDSRVLAACSEAGYDAVFTSIPSLETMPPEQTIGRLNVLGEMQPEWLDQLFTDDGKLVATLGRKQRRKDAVKRLLGDSLYAKLWSIANRQEINADEDAVR
jgi:peptidoglycan/xylan/chitin deacetylase (PgdA/CDA1 family)